MLLLTSLSPPSLLSTIVGLGDKRRTMGASARNQLVTHPKSTIWGFKHLVGRPFSDPFVEKERQQLPYDIQQLGADRVGIKVCVASTVLA